MTHDDADADVDGECNECATVAAVLVLESDARVGAEAGVEERFVDISVPRIKKGRIGSEVRVTQWRCVCCMLL